MSQKKPINLLFEEVDVTSAGAIKQFRSKVQSDAAPEAEDRIDYLVSLKDDGPELYMIHDGKRDIWMGRERGLIRAVIFENVSAKTARAIRDKFSAMPNGSRKLDNITLITAVELATQTQVMSG